MHAIETAAKLFCGVSVIVIIALAIWSFISFRKPWEICVSRHSSEEVIQRTLNKIRNEFPRMKIKVVFFPREEFYEKVNAKEGERSKVTSTD